MRLLVFKMAASVKRGLFPKAVTFYTHFYVPGLDNMQSTSRIVKRSLRSRLTKVKTSQTCAFYREKGTDLKGRIGMPFLQQQHNVIFTPDNFTSLRRQQNRSTWQHTMATSLLPHGRISKAHLPTINISQVRGFSSHGGQDEESNHPPNSTKRRMKLMDFQEIIWPSPFKTIRNYFFSFLISSYFDRTFSMKGFLNGAEQAVEHVSGCISAGNFENLDGLVAHEAIREIRNNYADLNDEEKHFISVRSSDFYFRYVFEIGMIFDDDTNQRFVEITAVFQGFPGFEDLQEEGGPQYYQQITENQQKVYVCNYRFIREFTKGVESDWTINKLNHFPPITVPVRF